MLEVMTQAMNAIQAYNSALQVHSANIANMSVTGYKRLDPSFQSIFEKAMRMGTAASNTTGGTNPMQLGQGVALSNIAIDMSQGTFVQGNSIDCAITGRGFFIVSNDGGQTYQYTRSGKFSIDSNGNLTTPSGLPVYGLSGNGLNQISGLTGAATDYSWDGAGNLLYKGSQTGYQIALAYFSNASGLTQTSGTTFAESLASGSASTPMASGGAAGIISPGNIEQSNVFYLGETIDSQEIQRAMSGNLSVVRMASDIISNFISKLG